VVDLQGATAAFCALSWAQAQALYPSPDTAAFLSTYCFGGTYAAALLSRGFGFDEQSHDQLRIVDTVGGVAAGWALGAMTYEAGLLPWRSPAVDPASPVHLVRTPLGLGLAVTGAALLLLAGVLLFFPRPGVLADPDADDVIDDEESVQSEGRRAAGEKSPLVG
jgi:hypothetical protein